MSVMQENVRQTARNPSRLRRLTAVLLAAALSLTPALVGTAHAAGSSGSVNVPTPSRAAASPEARAEAAYEKGLTHKKLAWKAETKAAAATSEKKKARFTKRAQKEYVKAQEQYLKVLKALPEHYKAANEMGYALRKTGDYRRAIGAYNLALKTNPDFLEAIEYRGEALVQLGFYDETRADYMRLFREKRELADQLMVAIDKWAATQTDPGVREKDFLQWRESRRNVGVLGDQAGTTGGSW